MSDFLLEPATYLGAVNADAFNGLRGYFGKFRSLYSPKYTIEDKGLVAVDPETADVNFIPDSVISPFICASESWLLNGVVRFSYSTVLVQPGDISKPQPWHFDNFGGGQVVRSVVFSDTIQTLVANGVMREAICYGGVDDEYTLPEFNDDVVDKAINDPDDTTIYLQPCAGTGQGIGMTEKTLHKPGSNTSGELLERTSIRLLTAVYDS